MELGVHEYTKIYQYRIFELAPASYSSPVPSNQLVLVINCLQGAIIKLYRRLRALDYCSSERVYGFEVEKHKRIFGWICTVYLVGQVTFKFQFLCRNVQFFCSWPQNGPIGLSHTVYESWDAFLTYRRRLKKKFWSNRAVERREKFRLKLYFLQLSCNWTDRRK